MKTLRAKFRQWLSDRRWRVGCACVAVALFASAANGAPYAVEYSASWCVPCQKMKPDIERLQIQGYDIRTIDFDANMDFARAHGITDLPAVVIVNQKREVARQTGYHSGAQLKAFLDQKGVKPQAK